MMLSFKSTTLTAIFFLLLALQAVAIEDHEGANEQVRIDRPPEPAFPTVCVKFAMFDNPRCWGNPKQVVKYPTFKEAGHSPCFSDPGKAISSLGDQYCDVSGQVYHVDFYPFNAKCEGKPLKLKIPTDGGCSLGVKVYNCKEKPCFMENDDDHIGVGEDFGDIAQVLQARMLQNWRQTEGENPMDVV